MIEQIEKLEHGLMICEATGTELVHIEKADAEKILVLLKEQEAVTVHDPGAFCPKCGWMLYPEDHPKFCGNCGYPVKWE